MAEIRRSPVEVCSEHPIIYKVLAPSQVVSRISSINSMEPENGPLGKGDPLWKLSFSGSSS